MNKAVFSGAFISKGYNGAPALKYSTEGNSVRFRIGQKVYDSREEGNQRWFNLSVKAFGDLCERIQKMKLKEGSCVNLSGRLDEDRWKDKDSGEERSMYVLIADDIEYAYSGKTDKGSNGSTQAGGAVQNGGQGQAPPQGNPYPQAMGGGYPQMAQGMPYQQAPQAGVYQQVEGQPCQQVQPMPQGASGYEGFTGYEPYGGNNIFTE